MFPFLIPAGLFGLAWYVSRNGSPFDQRPPLHGPGFGGMYNYGGAPLTRAEMAAYGNDPRKVGKLRQASYKAGVKTPLPPSIQTLPPRQPQRPQQPKQSMFRTEELFDDDLDELDELDELDDLEDLADLGVAEID